MYYCSVEPLSPIYWQPLNHHVQQKRTSEQASTSPPTTFDPSLLGSASKQRPIRDHLQQWELDNGGPDDITLNVYANHPAHDKHRITNVLSTLSPSNPKSADQSSPEHDSGEHNDPYQDDLVTVGLFLKPGDVVELSLHGHEPVLGVFVQSLANTHQFYSANGRWCHVHFNRISYVFQGCVDPALLDPIVPYMPTAVDRTVTDASIQIPPELGSPILSILDRLSKEAESIYRENASVLETAWSILAYEHRARIMTVEQMAKALLSKDDPDWKPSPAALLAVRKALSHNTFRLRPDTSHQKVTHAYTIQSKNDVLTIEKVLGWVREFKEHRTQAHLLPANRVNRRTEGVKNIMDFVQKARRLVSISRKSRIPTAGFIGPSNAAAEHVKKTTSNLTLTHGEAFTDADRYIIDFVKAWAVEQQFSDMPDLYSSCTAILNAVGQYQEPQVKTTHPSSDVVLDPSTGYLFLQEIGVLSPHDNRKLYDEQLMLPMAGTSHNIELLRAKSESAQENPGFSDTMSEFRRDWGKMPVWCIDDVEAKEIDDGVSVEKVPGKDSEYWIHVHVANPTAFFQKTNVLTDHAAHMSSTVYTPAIHFPMLPTWASQDYFGLDRDRPSITFSSRIDQSGNILEKKVQHAILRNVQKISYIELSEYMGEKNLSNPKQKPFRFVVGGQAPEKSRRPLPPRSEEELENLKDLYAAAKAAFAGRQAAGALKFRLSSPDVRVFEGPQTNGLNWLPPSTDRARFIDGDPIIEISTDMTGTAILSEINSKDIVEEMMLLACRSAASWCAERAIPVIFRGTIVPPAKADEEDGSADRFYQKVIEHQTQQLGHVSPSAVRRYASYKGQAIAHHAPIPHRLIGAAAYTKVTSPLRRFGDMIAHWQIEAAIRYEARNGHKLDMTTVSNASDTPLRFSQQQLQESILTLIPREGLISTVQRASNDVFALQAFKRAFHHGEASLPESQTVWIRQVSDRSIYGHLLGFNFTVVMEPKESDVEIREGDAWEAKIVAVNIFDLKMVVEPTRLIYREPLES
jgi:hypothetical protein